MKTQEPKVILLPEGKYLSQIEPFKTIGIPSNSIIHKVVTGCGATHCELVAKRNSIIILPNVPVIKGKVEAWNEVHGAKEKIVGIYKGKDIPFIEHYLESGATYKKILTTPEAFSIKVVQAFTESQNMIEDFFLLYDECDRLISDVSYRARIAAPLDLFFEFKHKALVSATVLPFCDERFNSFDHYILRPLYDYKKTIKLIETNNVLESTRRYLRTLDAPQVSIFINSTNTIASLIAGLGIWEESRVHCSGDSVNKLRVKWGFTNATSELDVEEFKRYNFFTSRFFSAVDIKVRYQPAIIMITELIQAEQSIIDPHTEAIQISGRYRNGIGSLAHISNFNPNISAMTPQETKGYLDAHFEVYKLLTEMHDNEENPIRKAAFESAYKSLPAHEFFKTGSLNTFMVDNVYHEERIKGYYRSSTELVRQYETAFDHFAVTLETERYLLSDADDISKYKDLPKAQQNRLAAADLNALTPRLNHFMLFEPEGRRSWIKNNYPLVTEAFDLIGIEGLDKTDYSDSAIRRAIRKRREELLFADMRKKVHLAFEGKVVVTDIEARKILQPIYDEAGYKATAKPSDIKRFFPDAKRTTVSGKHAQRLVAAISSKKLSKD
ncbi:MAG: hypothetical protein ACTHJ8_20280 [Mucilaginibacter sp.]